MFHILVVEDHLKTLEELRELLQEVFPDAQIESASTVEGGLQIISTAAVNKQSFDVAILDFKLPARKGLNPEIDESLCQEIKLRMPETLVIHITGFPDDSAVSKHITEHHTGKNAPRVELIQKTAYWPEKLLGETKSYFIGQQISRLFGHKAASLARNQKHGQNSGSLTQTIATLIRDIAAYWNDLDDMTKEMVRSHFDVSDEQAPVRVNLRLDI